jgi:CRISPR-associated protein Csb2
MAAKALLIEVRWPDGRFHGVREGDARGRGAEPMIVEWPPSPFRLFQALIAGAYGGRWATEDRAEKDAVFRWLECLNAPRIWAPPLKTLRPVTYYVPNNDLDAKGGDPAQVASVRTAKTRRPGLFDADRPAAYLWTFDGDDQLANRLTEMAGRLHALGHGVDAAFAQAEVLDLAHAEARLLALGGAPHKPAMAAAPGAVGSPCPTRGSFESLRRRHEAFTGRFERVGAGRKATLRFRQPPKPHVRAVAYDRTASRLLFELRPSEGSARFRSWPLIEAAALTIAVRDQLARALEQAWPEEVNRLVIGLGAGSADAAIRLCIVPLPSIGMRHTDPAIRRVLVEAPPDHPIPLFDIEWALAGRELADVHGEPTGVILTPTTDTSMLERFGVNRQPGSARVWRTVTPAVLPHERHPGGVARSHAEARLAGSIAQALRHAGVAASVTTVRVQREPFDLQGARADHFAPGRFDARDLRHVELTLSRPVVGPMVIGDGRFLGLGVMRPVPDRLVSNGARGAGLYAFDIEDGATIRDVDVEAVTRALRRAVMARAQAVAGRRLKRGEALPTFFSGHVQVGGRGALSGPAVSGVHEHLFYAVDLGRDGRPPRLLVIAPHQADRTPEVRRRTRGYLHWLDQALEGLVDLRAGSVGRFRLSRTAISSTDPIFGRGAIWTALVPYRPTRHPHRGDDVEASLRQDVLMECARRNVPKPDVEIIEWTEGERGGLTARIRLKFARGVSGPVLLGAGSHYGAGLFVVECDSGPL